MPGLQGPAPAAQPHAVRQERAGVLELAVGGLVLLQGPPVQRVAFLLPRRQGPQAGQLRPGLRIGAQGGPLGVQVDHAGDVLVQSRQDGRLHEARHREHPQAEVPAPGARPEQRPEPDRCLFGPALPQVGAGACPLRHGAHLEQPVRPGDRQGGLRVVLGGGVGAHQGADQRQQGVVLSADVALTEAAGGTKALLGVGTGLVVEAGAQFGVSQVLQDAGGRPGRALGAGGRQGAAEQAPRRGEVAEYQGRAARVQQGLRPPGPRRGGEQRFHLPRRPCEVDQDDVAHARPEGAPRRLRGTRLRGTRLRGTRLRGTRVRGADARDTRVRGAHAPRILVRGARVHGARAP
ncbi:pentapeptide repeat-containing protein [Streptomyces fradiae]|uniref:pentapeptide repeat-containing protein n=1 Tax=Streptomyces fradiae TaxID=1906 RepID=UPI0035BE66E0